MTADDIIKILTATPINHPVPYWVAWAAQYMCPPKVPPGRVATFYETTAVNFFPEVTVRVPVGGYTRRGKPRFQRRRMDLVALVQPHYRQWQPFVAGVEIKVSEPDLRNDDKLFDYPAYCHLFYLAVPDSLYTAALAKIEANPALKTAGLLLVEPSHARIVVARPPASMDPSEVERASLYAELLLRIFKLSKNECKNFYQFERR